MVCWQAGSFSPASLPMLNAFRGCGQVFLSAGPWQVMSLSWTPCAQPEDSEAASHPGDGLWIWCCEEGSKLGGAGVCLFQNTPLWECEMCVASGSFWDKMMKKRSEYMILLLFQLSWPQGYTEGKRGKKWWNCLVVKTHLPLLLSMKLRNGRRTFPWSNNCPLNKLPFVFKKNHHSMPNASENVHGVRVESTDIFSMRSERPLTRFSEFPLLLQEDQILSITSICTLLIQWI